MRGWEADAEATRDGVRAVEAWSSLLSRSRLHSAPWTEQLFRRVLEALGMMARSCRTV